MDAETETRSWGRRLRLREKRGKPLKEGGDRFIEQWDRDPKGAQRLRRGRSLKGVRAETRGQIFRERGERETRRDTETGAGVGREAIPTSRRTCSGRWRAGDNAARGRPQPLTRPLRSHRHRLPPPAAADAAAAAASASAPSACAPDHPASRPAPRAALDPRLRGPQCSGPALY